jgi:hypothetical protein
MSFLFDEHLRLHRAKQAGNGFVRVQAAVQAGIGHVGAADLAQLVARQSGYVFSSCLPRSTQLVDHPIRSQLGAIGSLRLGVN